MIIGFKKFTDWRTVADMALLQKECKNDFLALKIVKPSVFKTNQIDIILDLSNSRRRISNETETKLRIVAPKATFVIYYAKNRNHFFIFDRQENGVSACLVFPLTTISVFCGQLTHGVDKRLIKCLYGALVEL